MKTTFQEIESHIVGLTIRLFEVLYPYFYSEKHIEELSEQTLFPDTLARTLNNLMLYQQKPTGFYADSILPRKMVLSNEKNKIQFLGLIHWLETPSNYFTDGLKDVFYCDFVLENDKMKIENVSFGSNDKIDLETLWWNDFDINWIHTLKN
ncbi:hypothetical protein [Bernardetia sp. MNP-M8]|uniref:hypothetical protein n=1 Tax=Bernardetia sp. MNP-M8 TaxID=3127470 RepID=UPI0030D3713C